MTKADKIFKDLLNRILQEDWEVDNRAVWEDGSQVYTKRIFGIVNRYDLSEEFPALTVRKTMIKNAFKEIEWMFIKGSNNVNDFDSKIWDAWADEDGSIGKSLN